MAARRKYLNNRDLLLEIAKSKNSYCSYLEEDSHNYDIILEGMDKINIRSTALAKRNQTERIGKGIQEQHYEAYRKRIKLEEVQPNWKKIKKHEVIFRVLTFDHIPLEPGRKKNPKTVADHHTKLNYTPFQHFKYDEDDNLVCIGKSHWVGGMENGHFSKDHGNTTDTLSHMFMKLCERYGTRGNWRGYTYNDEMKSQALLQLVQIGLQFDEHKSQNPFAYYTAAMSNSFTRVFNLESKGQSIRDDILEMNDLTPSYTRQFKNDMFDESMVEPPSPGLVLKYGPGARKPAMKPKPKPKAKAKKVVDSFQDADDAVKPSKRKKKLT